MPIGLLYAGTYPIEEFLKLAILAEDVGIDSIWLTEEFVYRDPMVLAASLLQITKKIRVIPGPVSPYFKHPVAIAREMLSLCEIGKGRLGLQLGVGDINGLKLMGVDILKPINVVEESIQTIRALLSGERVNTKDGVWNLSDIQMVLGGKEKIPIYIAAMGKKMLALARKLADGTILSHMVSVPFIRKSIEMAQCLPNIEKTSNHEFYGFFAVSVADTRKSAYDQIRQTVAHWLGILYPQPVHLEDWALSDLDVDHLQIFHAIQEHDLGKACTLVSDKVLQTLSVSGTPDDFMDRIKQYLDAGVTYPVIGPIGDFETKALTIRLAGKMFGG